MMSSDNLQQKDLIPSEDHSDGGGGTSTPKHSRSTTEDSTPGGGGGKHVSHPSLPFFADAILDLDEAHDIADTPEATRPRFEASDNILKKNRHQLQVPSLKLDGSSAGSPQQKQHQKQRQLNLSSGKSLNAAGKGLVEESSMSDPLSSNQVTNRGPANGLGQTSASSTGSKTASGVKTQSASPLEKSHENIFDEKDEQHNNSLSSSSSQQMMYSSGTGNNNHQREKAKFSRITSLETDLRTAPPPVKPPRWPRDIPWAVAFILFVPTSLLYPAFIQKHNEQSSPLTRHPLSTATLHTMWWTAVATALLCRLLYRSVGGGEGDHARHTAASIMTLAAPISVLVYLLLAFIMYWSCPHARWAVLIPLGYTIRDVYLFRRWKRRTPQAGAGYASRQAFFQALVNMALDILSRSLRRESFYRVLTATLLVQLGVLILWRWALLGALASGSWFTLLTAAVAGKWATGTVARTLSLLASGGVMSWCFQQTAMLDEIQDSSSVGAHSFGHRNKSYPSNLNVFDSNELDGIGEEEEKRDDYHSGENGYGLTSSRVPEAYRTVDASVYESVVVMDNVLDDDYDDEEELEAPNRRGFSVNPNQIQTRSTVKSILSTGFTVSFGSIAHCGLLGGLAQFVWSQIRKAEIAHTRITEARQQRVVNNNDGFRGMQIGDDGTAAGKFWGKINPLARNFVRNHSDLAMTHVAAYYKGYQRAARDVATLIDESGVEPILHDDITTHICTCIGGSITGLIVVMTGNLLLHQRKNYEDVDDKAVIENMLIAFILSYTLIFTVMEPLRAAIKAIYVSFAHCPRSISQAFPLIFHRLCRISEPNVS